MASWSGIRSVIALASRARRARRLGVGRAGRDDVCVARPGALGPQAVDCVRCRGGRDGRTSTQVHERALTERPNSLLPAGVVRSTVSSSLVRSSMSPDPTERCSLAGSPRRERRRCHRSSAGTRAPCPTGMVNTVVHRDDLVDPRVAIPAERYLAERGSAARSETCPRNGQPSEGCSLASPPSTAVGWAPVSRPSSARSSERRLCASTLAVACSISSTRDST